MTPPTAAVGSGRSAPRPPPAVRGWGEVRSRSCPQSAPALLSAGHSCCMLARSSAVMEKLVPGLMWMLLFPSCTCYGRERSRRSTAAEARRSSMFAGLCGAAVAGSRAVFAAGNLWRFPGLLFLVGGSDPEFVQTRD